MNKNLLRDFSSNFVRDYRLAGTTTGEHCLDTGRLREPSQIQLVIQTEQLDPKMLRAENIIEKDCIQLFTEMVISQKTP